MTLSVGAADDVRGQDNGGKDSLCCVAEGVTMSL